MNNEYVGAGILNIITESLYDKPIVVFREYVQNSVDSILKNNDSKDRKIKIWLENNDLFFLDNGGGIDAKSFHNEMLKIGSSSKVKSKNLGYKGIGRLSGIPYCDNLIFINISDFANNQSQSYSIDCKKYTELRHDENNNRLGFNELMNTIGECNKAYNIEEINGFSDKFYKYKDMLEITQTGFLVALRNISSVLKNTIEANDFLTNLQWLLPVNFDESLYDSDKNELFEELYNQNNSEKSVICVCDISYNDREIFRPIKPSMFRDYVCKNNFKYAVGFHSFDGNKICINNKNSFSGIRIYIDNMLLCDENELLQSLDNFGLLSHTLNGQIQSVRGIGAMIYITDKLNISANARRTFIEVTNADALEFLKLLAEFVNTIYDTRYALSDYSSAKEKCKVNTEKLQSLKDIALTNLQKLAKEHVELIEDAPEDFSSKSLSDKRRILKRLISIAINNKINEYVRSSDFVDARSAVDDFIKWLKNSEK